MPDRLTLLALIEAGQHAHRVLLRPLVERGLQPGDDAILLLLGEGAVSDADLEDGTGIPREALEPRVDRLVQREFIVRTAMGLALTERGARFHQQLLAVWDETELALTGSLKKKHRKRLAEVLIAFAVYMRGRGG